MSPLHLEPMNVIHDLAGLETLLDPSHAMPTVCVKFKATWCAPCKRLQMDRIVAAAPGVAWYEVDADECPDVLDYCGITTIPAFLAIRQGMPQPVFQSSDTAQVADWVAAVCRK